MCSVAHNRGKNGDGVVEESYPSITAELDIEGNVLAVVDARGNRAMRSQYDLLGRALHQESMDAGERWSLPDIGGQALYQWDSRDHRVRNVFDPLHRPIEQWLSVGGGAETLFQSKQWGELAPDAQTHNLCGQLWKSYDQAGMLEAVDHDFKGNMLESRRQFTTAYDQTIAWPNANAEALLDIEAFRTRARYDALNRATQLFSPDTPTITGSEITLGYDEGGRLKQVSAALRGSPATSFVDEIDYNEKGQRLLIRYGNGLTTQYEYEADTFRLSHLITARGAGPVLQDLRYVYDPVANIVSQTDDAQQSTYFGSAVAVPAAPTNTTRCTASRARSAASRSARTHRPANGTSSAAARSFPATARRCSHTTSATNTISSEISSS